VAAPQAGQKAPDFTLPDQNGNAVTLAGLLAPPQGGPGNGRANAVLLIFYRGYW
jgi:peroxiredoxin